MIKWLKLKSNKTKNPQNKVQDRFKFIFKSKKFISNTEDKKVSTTGGTHGIGEATPKYLTSIGLNLIIFGRSLENRKRIKKQINENCDLEKLSIFKEMSL